MRSRLWSHARQQDILAEESSMNALDCFTDETLQAYQNGTVEAGLLEEVESHLRVCSTCLERLQSVGIADDPLLLALRRQQAPPQPIDPLLAAAVSRALSLQPEALAGSQPVMLACGTMLHEYRLLERLGSGGMGTVYRALHVRLDKEVALKVIQPARVRDAGMRERFGREMKAIGKLRHPHIVLATDAGEAQGVLYLVMELEQGADLAKYVREQGGLSVAEACAYAQQAALGLQYAHEAGLVHRDIKPSNLFRTASGQIKLLDLGLALLEVADELPPDTLEKPVDIDAATDVTPLDTHCTLGPMGTDDYMAPEQWHDAHRVDARADLYSLGCTLFFLLTGRAPFSTPPGLTRRQIRDAHLNTAPPALRALRPDAPPRLEALLNRLLAKKAEDRPASAAEVARQLAACSRPRSNRVLWVSGAAALLLVGALAAAAVLNLSSDEMTTSVNDKNTAPQPAETAPPPTSPPSGALPMTPAEAQLLQKQWADHLQRKSIFTNSLGMDFTLIPPGEFLDVDGAHMVIGQPYYLGVTEVTMRQFGQFVVGSGHVTEVEKFGRGGIVMNQNKSGKVGRSPAYTWSQPGYAAESQDCPVVQVTWNDAMAYCAWLSKQDGLTYRLQTPSEWVWASRAGYPELNRSKDENQFEQDWLLDNAHNRPHAVRTRQSNPWGLYDVNGNVSEWCLNDFEILQPGIVVDQPVLTASPLRVTAGSCYLSKYSHFRPRANRIPSTTASTIIGFRVLCEVAPGAKPSSP
jgi:eukaryotic-like serine/threonine-protein kinase